MVGGKEGSDGKNDRESFTKRGKKVKRCKDNRKEKNDKYK